MPGGSGALLSLVAYGSQDVMLTGQPEVSYWRMVTKRYTSFALESIEQVVQGSTGGFGSRLNVIISRSGDLLKDSFLEISLPTLKPAYSWVRSVGFRAVRSCSLQIGGQIIDTIYGSWMEIFHELNTPEGKFKCLDTMVGRDFTGKDQYGRYSQSGGRIALETLQIPLAFFYTRAPGLALPLIALQYHAVELVIELEDFTNLIRKWNPVTALWDGVSGVSVSDATESSGPLLDIHVWTTYVFLDQAERKWMATNSHNIMIQQLQFTGVDTVRVDRTGVMQSVRLNLNHPCTALVWTAGLPGTTGSLEGFDFDYSPQKALSVVPRVDRGQMMATFTLNGAVNASNNLVVNSTIPAGLWSLVVAGNKTVGPWNADVNITVTAFGSATDATVSANVNALNAAPFGVLLSPNIFPLYNHNGDVAIASGIVTAFNSTTIKIDLDNDDTSSLIVTGARLYEDKFGGVAYADTSILSTAVTGSADVRTLTYSGTAAFTLVVGMRIILAHGTVTVYGQSASFQAVQSVHPTATEWYAPCDSSSSLAVPNQNPIDSLTLSLNGTERFTARPGAFFSRTQPFAHAARCPTKPIMMYSFAISPFTADNGSGSTNFSRIDSALIQVKFRPPALGKSEEMRELAIYAVNWNQLRIVSGMAGLSWSN